MCVEKNHKAHETRLTLAIAKTRRVWSVECARVPKAYTTSSFSIEFLFGARRKLVVKAKL